MPIYRYSAEGVERLVRRIRNRSLTMISAALLSGIAITAFAQGLRQSISILPVLVPAVGILWWTQRRSSLSVRKLLESTEFEIDDATISGRNSNLATTLRREEIVELRYLSDGVFIRSRNLDRSLQLKPELEDYDDLIQRLEAWVPAEVPRVRSVASLATLNMLFGLAGLGLFIVAFAATNPLTGMVACLAEAALLIACFVWIWRSEQTSRQIKWLTALGIFPVISLLGRAYMLSAQIW